jgi:lysophospholipid acyltransferase (LPLAT)-like uncharacterized protein
LRERPLCRTLGVPIFVLGAECRPAISERHKWDRARNPLPFSRLVIVVGESRTFSMFDDLASIEQARCSLQCGLDQASAIARQALYREAECDSMN